jgi:transposase InsO family protein
LKSPNRAVLLACLALSACGSAAGGGALEWTWRYSGTDAAGGPFTAAGRLYTGKSSKTHEGVIITLKSNLRWCSDSFEIRWWNGERVQVAFALDCCDREAMRWVATTAAITGEMVRDLMAESVEHRFGPGVTRAPHPIEWLSDNSPPYTANETRTFGESLGLLICTTPAYSPESNGMAESFVKTSSATTCT